MLTLPPEVLLGVVEQLHDQNTLKNLSLVNSLFRNDCEAKLFNEVKLDKSLEDSMAKLAVLNDDGCRLGRCVNVLLISTEAIFVEEEDPAEDLKELEFHTEQLTVNLVALFTGLATKSRHPLNLVLDGNALDRDNFFEETIVRCFLESVFHVFGCVNTSKFCQKLAMSCFEGDDMFPVVTKTVASSSIQTETFRNNMRALKAASIYYEDIVHTESEEAVINEMIVSLLTHTGIVALDVEVGPYFRGLSLPLLRDPTGRLTSLTIQNTCINASIGAAIASCVGIKELTLVSLCLNWHPEYDDPADGLTSWETFFSSLKTLPLVKVRMDGLHSCSCPIEECLARHQFPMLISERDEDFDAMEVLVNRVLANGGKVSLKVTDDRYDTVNSFSEIRTCWHNRVEDRLDYRCSARFTG